MALDIFFRAKDRATYIKWLTRSQVRAIIGDLRARDEGGNAILQGIPGSVDLVQWDVNEIVEVPGGSPVLDPQAWIQVRLTGIAEVNDFFGMPIDPEVEFDRWEHSKLVNLVKSAGQSAVHRGVSTVEIKTGPNKGISVLRGSELETTIKFHEFLGGNSY